LKQNHPEDLRNLCALVPSKGFAKRGIKNENETILLPPQEIFLELLDKPDNKFGSLLQHLTYKERKEDFEGKF
jgi:hypothetical protein